MLIVRKTLHINVGSSELYKNMNYPLNKLLNYEQCVLSDKLWKIYFKNYKTLFYSSGIWLKLLGLYIDTTFSICCQLYYKKRICRHRFYHWIACYTPARRSTSTICLNLPLIVCVSFPLGVWGRMWNSTVSVPDHCLFIYVYGHLLSGHRYENKSHV